MLAPWGRRCWEDRKRSSIETFNEAITINDFGTTNRHDFEVGPVGTDIHLPSNRSSYNNVGDQIDRLVQVCWVVGFLPIRK